ncbi:hypothetical protein [Limnoglobus roseus]|nr:hypothetical protein [Limnoglobus roseus]
MTNPVYQRDRDDLRAAYEAAAVGDCYPFPFLRQEVESMSIRRLQEGPRKRFAEHALGFMSRWGLTGLTTWDLPDPERLLLPNPYPTNYGVPDTLHGVHIYVPVHYPLQKNDPLLEDIRRAQERAAVRNALPPEFAGIRHHGQLATIFLIVYVGQVLKSRFPDALPRGFVKWMESCQSRFSGTSLERVGALHKEIKNLGRKKYDPDDVYPLTEW